MERYVSSVRLGYVIRGYFQYYEGLLQIMAGYVTLGWITLGRVQFDSSSKTDNNNI